MSHGMTAGAWVLLGKTRGLFFGEATMILALYSARDHRRLAAGAPGSC
jgi:hypothetical protein